MTGEIQLPLKLMQQMLFLAQQQPDQEICGLISAYQQHPYRCYPIDNIAVNPQKQFLLHSQQHIAAIKQIREREETLFAIYHSHPHSDPIPSAMDIMWAECPDLLHLIISLNTKGLLEIRAFQIRENQVNPFHLCLVG